VLDFGYDCIYKYSGTVTKNKLALKLRNSHQRGNLVYSSLMKIMVIIIIKNRYKKEAKLIRKGLVEKRKRVRIRAGQVQKLAL